jgi:hypothetical protein
MEVTSDKYSLSNRHQKGCHPKATHDEIVQRSLRTGDLVARLIERSIYVGGSRHGTDRKIQFDGTKMQ